MNKKGDAHFLYLIGAIIVITIIALLYKTTVMSTEDQSGKSIFNSINGKDNIDKKTSNQDTSQSGWTKESNSQSSPSEESSSSGGGGSSGGGESDETQSSVCTIEKLTYSIETMEKNETCLNYSNEICIKKFVSCAAKIKNEDSVPTLFEIELIFVPDRMDKETSGFGHITENYNINPDEEKIISGEEILDGTEENKIANVPINCFFNTLNDIEKETCA
jgi:hypothetical protein